MRKTNKSLSAILAGSALLLTAGIACAQSVVNLTAARQRLVAPDGNIIPMWGWLCGNPAATTAGGTGTPAASGGATCTQTNGAAQSLGTTTPSNVWQPPLITVPYTATAGASTTGLSLTLTNTLPVPTSLTIVGQLPNAADVNGAGHPTRESGRPQHVAQSATTWTTVVTGQAPFQPPTQGARAQSFVQESQSNGTITYTWTSLTPGTYLIESGSYPSIQGPMGLYGVLVVTAAPTGTGTTAFASGTAYPSPAGAVTTTGVPYDADAVLLMSEIDAVQNQAADTAVLTTGFSPTKTWTPACSPTGPAATANTCYPPAVDFTPTYYLINGHSFDRTNPAVSAVSVGSNYSNGNVLLRFVNAGLRMHMPSVVGLRMALIADDAHLQPDVVLALTKGTALATCPSGNMPIVGGCPKVQNDWFMPAGKVLDIVVKPTGTAAGGYASAYYPAFDRQLSLSTNNLRDGGMQAFIVTNGGALTVNATTGLSSFANVSLAAATVAVQANPDNYILPAKATSFSGNVLYNDVGITAATLVGTPAGVTLNPNGAFTYTGTTATSFQYCGNGATSPTASPTMCATVTIAAATVGSPPTALGDSFTSKVATLLNVSQPGVLANDTDPTGYALFASTSNTAVVAGSPFTSTTGGCTVTLESNGSFTAQSPSGPNTCTFSYYAVNSQGTASAAPATVTLTFPTPSNLSVTVADAQSGVVMTDYKWILEQDLTFKIDPACQQNGPGGTKPATCPAGVPPSLATTFFSDYSPVIASGCTGPQSCERGQSVFNPVTGGHLPATCNHGICTATTTGYLPISLPRDVQLNALDPDGVSPARYYISILPGDSANPANVGANGYAGAYSQPGCEQLTLSSPTTATGQQVPACGHTMSGAPIPAPVAGVFAPVVIPVEPNPVQTAQLTIFVFEDDFPLNGEPDTGGNNNEQGLGGFQVELWDEMSQAGDFTGQMTYDIFNMPLSNSLNGTIDPLTGHNACPVAATAPDNNGNANQVAAGMIIVCPQFEDDGVTPSPLAGNAVVKNLMPGRFGVVVHPSAAREAAGEVWYQTNTLDGTHYLDTFVKIGEPAYFQEYGPGGWHAFIGMANPAVINARKAAFCNGPPALSCTNTIKGQVSNLHESRAPDETLYDSGVFPIGDPRNYQALAHTTCWAALGDTDGATFAFTNCDANGNYTFTGIPDGNWALVIGDQWDDVIIDGSSRPVNVCSGPSCPTKTPNPFMMDYPVFLWQTKVLTNTFMDLNGNGIQEAGEPGLLQVPNRIRFRNGRFNNTLLSDVSGHANFNETFPLFSWYVIESDNTRFKNTGVHVVYDFGGQIDGPSGTNCLGALSGGSSNQSNSATNPCGNGTGGSYQGLLNSSEPAAVALPGNLRYPGSYYCTFADCSELVGTTGFPAAGGAGGSTGRIDPGSVVTEGLQGFLSQTEIVEWGKLPYLPGENGGIRGHVVYSSTRPFDDPAILFQNLWEPLVPNVTINLYQETVQPDGSVGLKLIDTTKTSSWDAYAQGFRSAGIPNMNCPGQPTSDPFFPYTLAGTPNYLTPGPLPYNSQYKCYDGMHNFNQVQPAPYDGLYQFPTANCTACIANPNAGQVASPATILPQGKYVVEVVVPPGYELVKEEDKNILIGDSFIAPATVGAQFIGLGDIFIVPDQASINQNNINGVYNAAIPSNLNNPSYTGAITGGANPYNANGTPAGNNGNPTTSFGRQQFGGFGPGGLTTLNSPCVGEMRIVPDYMSISPESGQVAPFAGASRPLCDRKELTLEDQMQAQAEFFVWTKTPAASHYSGFILDDFSSEFNQAAPTFGEKFAPPNLPVSIKDFNGVEISRTYSDQWGLFNGLAYSTWEVNPPNPTGYAPNMFITEMNSPGPIVAPVCTTAATPTTPAAPLGCVTAQTNPPIMITDPYFNPGLSTFDYENPFMPGDTVYLDTPVVPVMAFAEGYNPPDCSYPDATPGIKSVVATSTGTTGTGDGLPANTASGTTTAGVGPWVSASGHNLTITALGDQVVPNPAYSGPGAGTAPFNLKFITRHYGFGTSAGSVTIGGVTATVVGPWTDQSITVTVPTLPAPPANSSCAIQQKNVTAVTRCGELVVTTAAGQSTVDSVTVTVGGKRPTYIAKENAAGTAVQQAIDAASPGDEIVIGPGTYTEMLIVWKPLRLQGVAAASVFINANTQPAGKLDPWRRKIDCLFGLGLNGQEIGAPDPITGAPNPYDSTGTYTCNFGTFSGGGLVQAAVDPIELEPIIGWDANLNGNLAELLQEPTLMGAYEGAAITVLAKGLENYAFNSTSTTCGAEGNGGCITLNATTDCAPTSPYYSGNFLCNPSRIDGLTLTNSSQGGGGLLIHGWNHHLEVSNNRITGNAGTLTGGIEVGLSEVPDPTLSGTDAMPLAINTYVNMHNNSVTMNMSYGDELNSNTPAAGGGVSITPGSDNYTFSRNWVCGNLSSGDGGGLTHFGLSFNGTISHNAFLFNQSQNPTLTTNGGGLIIEGSPPDGTLAENSQIDLDAGPSLSDGVGSGNVVDANLIMGNTAESGEGGGLRLQSINGNDVLNNPSNPSHWYAISVTNNIIVNNVSGWNGGGVSIADAVKVDFRNNTVASNDSTASAGVLFDTVNSPNANTAPPGCDPSTGSGCTNPVTTSTYEPAGLVTHVHSLLLSPAFTNPAVACPTGHPNCTKVSIPVLANDIFFQNRAFYLSSAGSPAVVVLTPQLSQTVTGACPTTGATAGGPGPQYWDIGVYGDTSVVGGNSGGYALSPTNSMLTTLNGPGGGYSGNGNQAPASAGFVGQYCNGSRVPPEIAPSLCAPPVNGSNPTPGCTYPGAVGITTPPNVPDINPFYPSFTLTPAATVDEGNNAISMYYGPLSTVNPAIQKGSAGYGAALGNYSIAPSSTAVNAIPVSVPHPATDFFGNPRPDNTGDGTFDIGAVEIAAASGGTAVANVTPTSLAFGNQATGTTSASQPLTLHNTGTATLTGIGVVVTAPFSRPAGAAGGTCGLTLNAGTTCTINVRFSPTGLGAANGTATITANVAVSGSPVALTGTGVAPVAIANVTGGPLAFGNWATGTTSSTRTLTLHNTGTAALTGVTVAVTAPFTRSGGSCTATLGAGGNCTINVVFSPTATGAANGTVTITGSVAVTGSPVTLTGTGVGTRAALSITPNPLTITLATGVTTGTGTVTLANTAAAGGSNVAVTNVTVPLGGSMTTYFFSLQGGGADHCTGATLAPGANCTVGVRFTNVGSPRGVDRAGTITFTDTGAGSPQTGNVTGHANP